MKNLPRILAFVTAVVVGTTLVILMANWITGSWAVGAAAGVIAAVLSTAMYPVVFRQRS